jgi:hypothetical protein
VGVSSILLGTGLPARVRRKNAYKRPMDKPGFCTFVYTKRRQASGWTWQAVSAGGKVTASPEIYDLFYDCVVAARARGYTPVAPLKCA